MGVDHHTLDVLGRCVSMQGGIRLLELGNQWGKLSPWRPSRPMKKWFTERGVKHTSIDLNGRDGAIRQDFAAPFPEDWQARFDVVTDFGSTEHCTNLVAAWKNIASALRVGGVAFHVLPEAGSWKGHAFHYFRTATFQSLAHEWRYELIHLERYHPRPFDGTRWLVVAGLRKTEATTAGSGILAWAEDGNPTGGFARDATDPSERASRSSGAHHLSGGQGDANDA